MKFEKDGELGIITFTNSPLNLIDSSFMEELETILNELENQDIRSLLFKTDEGNFSAGANVTFFQNSNEKSTKKILEDFASVIYRIEQLPYPTMAVVKGMCIGGGFELALACDYIWTSDNAQFAAAEVLLGIVPLGGGVQRLAQRCGATRAKEITLSGRFFNPEKLERWNVINRVLPEQDLIDKAIKFMKIQSNGPTLAFNTIKKLLGEYYHNNIKDSDKLLLEIVPKLFQTEDIKIGIESFKKKGPGKAIFKGK